MAKQNTSEDATGNLEVHYFQLEKEFLGDLIHEPELRQELKIKSFGNGNGNGDGNGDEFYEALQDIQAIGDLFLGLAESEDSGIFFPVNDCRNIGSSLKEMASRVDIAVREIKKTSGRGSPPKEVTSVLRKTRARIREKMPKGMKRKPG